MTIADIRRVPAPRHALLGETIDAGLDTDHMSARQIALEIDAVEADGFDTSEFQVEFHKRLAEPFGADELPDTDYPFILTTGRVLEHWHTGVMTRRSHTLNAREPEAFVEINPEDMAELGVAHDDMVHVSSRRGEITLKVRRSIKVQKGTVFIPFHFREAAANALTTDKLDPYGKIPEFKFCAVKVSPV